MTATRRRGAELERAILDAGWQQLLEGGYGGFTFEAVAERAETGKAALYRRWPNKEALLLAVVSHSYLGKPRKVPDTGSLREDVLEMLRQANRLGESAAAVFSTILGTHFEDIESTPARLRARLLGGRDRAMPQIIDRAIERGEITGPVPARVADLPFDLFRHELIMNMGPVREEVIVDIVDTLFMPLVQGMMPHT
ncbi:TetR/AcrR family transcriptional regulator [Arthrobacter sp.]|uniref:TetR/AcrR family transcriptional regulator n=1 Tax=Arthrobacter sp. TaxID=1667 RepID=UPI003A8FB6E2